MGKCATSPVCGNQQCKHWSEVKPGIEWALRFTKSCGYTERKI